MKFSELFPNLDLTVEDYFNEFREPDCDLAQGAKARFVLKDITPRRFAYVLMSKPVCLNPDNQQLSEERKEFLKELDKHEFYFIVLFEEDNSKSILIPDETFSDLDDVRDRAKYCLQRYNPETIEQIRQEIINSLR